MLSAAGCTNVTLIISQRSGLRRKGDGYLMTSLYVDIVRLRIAALEIVKRRLAVRIIENVFDLSLERLAFDCSYGEQSTICGRSRAPRPQ